MLDQIKIYADGAVGIVMFQAHEESLIDKLYAELFMKFPFQRCFATLVVHQLAAREFPQSGEQMVAGTLRYQDAAFTVKQNTGGYVNLPWHCLYFLPEPQGQGSFLPTFRSLLTKGAADAAAGGALPPCPPVAGCCPSAEAEA